MIKMHIYIFVMTNFVSEVAYLIILERYLLFIQYVLDEKGSIFSARKIIWEIVYAMLLS